MRSLATRVKAALGATEYMCIATHDGLRPWSAPVYFAFDDDFHLFFASSLDTRHTIAMIREPLVSITIYNSLADAPWHTSLLIEGRVNVVDEARLQEVIELISVRQFPDPEIRGTQDSSPEQFLGESIVRLFEVSPVRIALIEEDGTFVGRTHALLK